MISAIGCASVVLAPPEGAASGEPELLAQLRPHAFLKERKSLKYMGLQDQLGVMAAGKALESAGAAARVAGDRTGLYLAVGYIPFERRDIDPVLSQSIETDQSGQQAFSVKRFSLEGYQRAHPLLAFRCLPNMPAYHIAANFGITGPYSVAYPGVGQLYMALEQAIDDLTSERVDLALVGGVAHQRNFLVEHHMARGLPSVEATRLRDAASMLVLEREATLAPIVAPGQEERGAAGDLGATPTWPKLTLRALSVDYEPFDPLTSAPSYLDQARAGEQAAQASWPGGDAAAPLELGPASLGCALFHHFASQGSSCAELTHTAHSRDGIRAESTWTALRHTVRRSASGQPS